MALNRFRETRTKTRLPCEVCGTQTSENKPYCINCIDNYPYIVALKKQVEFLEQEEKKAADAVQNGTKIIVPKKSIILEEIINHLKIHGPKTVERLARELNHSAKIIHAYVRAMVRRKLIKAGLTRRQKIIASALSESVLL